MGRINPTLATLGIAVLFGIAVVLAPAAPAVLFPLGVGIALLRVLVLAVTEDEGEAARLGRWVSLALAAHIVAGYLGHRFDFAPDIRYYDYVAHNLTNHWRHDYPVQALPFGKEGFIYMLAALYRLLGRHVAAGVLVNCVFATATIPIVYDTTKRLFGRESARFVGPMMLLPAFLLWTSMLLREAGIILLIAMTMNAATRLSYRFGAGRFILMAASLAFLFTFRANVALVLAGSLLPVLAFSRRELVAGLGTGITATALIVVLVLGAGIGYSGYQYTAGSASLEQLEDNRRALSVTAESGFSEGADVSTPRGALTYLPIGLVNFMLGPFPWQMTNARQLLALPDVVLWLGLMPSLWRGTREGLRRNARKALLQLVPAGVLAMTLSLFIGNFGTAVRERIQIVVILVPFVALGLALRRPRPGDAAPSGPDPVSADAVAAQAST